MKELKIEAEQNGTGERTQNWVTHSGTMIGEIIPKHILQYKSKGPQDGGRPWKIMR
jgi:hypothetical protein